MIDVSLLTPSEQEQLQQNKKVLTHGDVPVAVYMRYSSERQTEQSIEGQLRDSITYCLANNYKIVAVYVDRATSASKDVDKRVNFLRMISDSDHRTFQNVIVWKLDRFARNRTDSAVYKMRLRKNGVRVVSVTENISDNPEGIILESVLEGMAEFYSAELAQKINRGLRESVLKGNCVGGSTPLGYIAKDKHLVIDPIGADIVKQAFTMYADGWTVADICREFNRRGYRSSKGHEFMRTSFKSMLKNKKYIGVYTYKDMEITGAIPPIIDNELFEAVQKRLAENGDAPARGKAKVDYLLSGKLFCGHCGNPMNGDTGTSKTGKRVHYYNCYGRKRKHNCTKKAIRKEVIEQWVVEDTMTMLTDDLIEQIANAAVEQTELDIANNTLLPALEQRHHETINAVSNINKAIEQGAVSPTLIARLNELESIRADIERQMVEENKKVVRIEKPQVIYWLNKFKDGDVTDETFRRQLIDLLVNSVTLYDNPDGDYTITIAYNLTSYKPKTFKVSESSDLKGKTPPKGANPNTVHIYGYVFALTKKHTLP